MGKQWKETEMRKKRNYFRDLWLRKGKNLHENRKQDGHWGFDLLSILWAKINVWLHGRRFKSECLKRVFPLSFSFHAREWSMCVEVKGRGFLGGECV